MTEKNNRPADDESMLDFTEDILGELLGQDATAEKKPRLEKRPAAPRQRQPRLHGWFVSEHELEEGGSVLLAHGVVEGHPTLEDDEFIHTSAVRSISVDRRTTAVIIRTHNTEYHCSMRDCNLVLQLQEDADELSELLLYAGEWAEATQLSFGLRDNAVLLQLSSESHRYFGAAIAQRNGALSILTLHEPAGVGEEECLVKGGGLSLQYLPTPDGIVLLEANLHRLELFLENSGEEKLRISSGEDSLEVWPGERRKIGANM